MSLISHPATGLFVGDPEQLPFTADELPSIDEIQAALKPLILSASGWRKVFAAPEADAPRAPWAAPARPDTGDEDSLSPRVAPADLVLAGAMARAFYAYIAERTRRPDPAILVGIDARPTGPAIADAMLRVLLALGARPRYLFIVAAPEIMAYARSVACLPETAEERAEGFIYISASHNPPGHNGVKFGVGGGVLPGSEAAKLIAAFTAIAADPAVAKDIFSLFTKADPRALATAYSAVSAHKRRAVSAYTLFAREVVTGSSDAERQEELLAEMARAAQVSPRGVVAELNGSARALSIDADFLEGLGLLVESHNAEPRAFAHRIVPEGESLAPCAAILEAAHARNSAFIAGYVPDCDGDRGNLVWFDREAGRARVLEAQEVFALCVVAELASLVRAGTLRPGSRDGVKVAVAVNDGTSMRIEAIARVFGAEVFRAETGEANVVGLAAALRERGYVVRILGEGSNGGNITAPSEVRDPLATLGALLKLLLLRDSERGEGLFHTWTRLRGCQATYRPDFDLGTVIASLPRFATTSAFEARAALRIASADHAALKARYQSIFLREWENRKAELEERFGITAFRAFATNGSVEREIGSDFSASGRGGLRIVLVDRAGENRAFLWMRGSGTEPVFRVMADVAAQPGRDVLEDERALFEWHVGMVREADRLAENSDIR